jgi:hypothetical protein
VPTAEHFWGGLLTQHTPSLASSAVEHWYVAHVPAALVICAPLQVVVAAEHFWFAFFLQHTPSLASSAVEHWYVVHVPAALVSWAPLQVVVAAEHCWGGLFLQQYAVAVPSPKSEASHAVWWQCPVASKVNAGPLQRFWRSAVAVLQ